MQPEVISSEKNRRATGELTVKEKMGIALFLPGDYWSVSGSKIQRQSSFSSSTRVTVSKLSYNLKSGGYRFSTLVSCQD